MKGPVDKPILWAGSSKKDIREFPDDVKQDLGIGLRQVQQGKHPSIAKVLKGFKAANVIELKCDSSEGGTFRAVYTVRFEDAIVVLHVFQKKSKSGIATPKREIDKIHARLAQATQMYEEWKKGLGEND